MDHDANLRAELERSLAECKRLRKENEELRARLGDPSHDAFQAAQPTSSADLGIAVSSPAVTAGSRPELKVSLFRSLFRGRDDVYAVRWEGRTGRTGYSPAGIREWNGGDPAATGKKRAVRHTQLFSLSEEVIRDHLLGNQTIGVYPLLQDDTCWFVAVDFDKKTWQADSTAFLATCRAFGVPAALERSRSGNGGHIWIFFSAPAPAAVARRLASALLTRTMEQSFTVGLDSYDRLFPSQDTLPKGGFGNLIALPLQRGPRRRGNSVFVNENFRPHDDQWAFLSSIRRLTPAEVHEVIRAAFPTGDVIGVRHDAMEDDHANDPCSSQLSDRSSARLVNGPLPARVPIRLENMVYIEKNGLPTAFLDRLIRLAAFQNPEFYSAQAMRLSTFGKPRVIACAEDLPNHIALPRGLLQEALALFESNAVTAEVTDNRFGGIPIEADFHGDVRPGQKEAAKILARFNEGILCAPTAFGKTAVAAQLISIRKVNTLILVHRRLSWINGESGWLSSSTLMQGTSAKLEVAGPQEPGAWM